MIQPDEKPKRPIKPFLNERLHFRQCPASPILNRTRILTKWKRHSAFSSKRECCRSKGQSSVINTDLSLEFRHQQRARNGEKPPDAGLYGQHHGVRRNELGSATMAKSVRTGCIAKHGVQRHLLPTCSVMHSCQGSCRPVAILLKPSRQPV